MEGIAKYVLTMAGEGKKDYIMPENKCIRVEDVEKVLMDVGVPDSSSDLRTRDFLRGTVVCIDSINNTLLEETLQLISTYFKDYIDLHVLQVTPSPLLQDYIVHQLHFDDSFVITTYCERVATVGEASRYKQ